MDTLKLCFETDKGISISVSSVQNKYDKKNLLPIVMEEINYNSYLIHVFGADNLESVFPVIKVDHTAFLKLHLNNRSSPCLQVENSGELSSFPVGRKVYGLEILNETKQKLFESNGGHSNKVLTVEYSPDEGQDECGIYLNFERRGRTEFDGCSRIETDGCRATVALNNTSTETFNTKYFKEPQSMVKRHLYFVFEKKEKMMGNLYLD